MDFRVSKRQGISRQLNMFLASQDDSVPRSCYTHRNNIRFLNTSSIGERKLHNLMCKTQYYSLGDVTAEFNTRALHIRSVVHNMRNVTIRRRFLEDF
jgi:hypothetical protein